MALLAVPDPVGGVVERGVVQPALGDVRGDDPDVPPLFQAELRLDDLPVGGRVDGALAAHVRAELQLFGLGVLPLDRLLARLLDARIAAAAGDRSGWGAIRPLLRMLREIPLGEVSPERAV